MKNKSLFVIGPHHYCHSTAALIEGLNKLGVMKVFSNSNHNYCKFPLLSHLSRGPAAGSPSLIHLICRTHEKGCLSSGLQNIYKPQSSPLRLVKAICLIRGYLTA